MIILPISRNINSIIKGIYSDSERHFAIETFEVENILHTICAFANDINNYIVNKVIAIYENNGDHHFS